ncbi:MAG: hypothetical protein ACI3YX_07330, partial [Prevotella sp.]
DEVPSYYGFTDYVECLKKDIAKAEELLKGNDPIFTYTFTQLNNTYNMADDYMCYRQSRLNYWAVRALHARMALYTGENAEANAIATEIIQAKGADGEPLMTLSGTSDLNNGYNGLPSECLFYLSKYNINSYANEVLIGGRTTQVHTSTYYLTSGQLSDLYASVPGSTASHNRYLYQWNRNALDAYGKPHAVTKKYWYDEASAKSSDLVTKHQIIPMLRLSEMYLIAIETSGDLATAQSLYNTYMSECQFTLYEPFASLEAAKEEMVNEYRRELFAEGQMFYCYKRHAAKRMMWNDDEMTEDSYILPLPSTEILNQ